MIMRYITTVITPIIMITVVVSNWIFTNYNQSIEKKRGLISGIILTVTGLAYSTFQTLFIIKTIKKAIRQNNN